MSTDEELVDARTDPPHAVRQPPHEIITEGLTKVFGGVAAVAGLDLAVGTGEVFGLLGPNGAGKTTTIGMLTTRVVPTSGHATVAGLDVVRRPAAVKARIGVVAQRNTLDRSLTVAENLELHGRYFGWPRRQALRRARELLERFRLDARADADVEALSGGMAQRLMVARAVFHHPAVLFLDEPTTGLDPQSRIALWDLLRALNAEGQTTLLTTHYMEEADRLCDRVAIMDGGRILALDTPAALKREAGIDAEIVLTADGDLRGLADTIRTVDGVTGADVHDREIRIAATTTAGLLPRLLLAAEAAGHSVRDVAVQEPSLERAFIAVTGRDLRE